MPVGLEYTTANCLNPVVLMIANLLTKGTMTVKDGLAALYGNCISRGNFFLGLRGFQY
jgi:hypothetical protein